MAQNQSFHTYVDDPPQETNNSGNKRMGVYCVGITLLLFSAFYLGRQSALTIVTAKNQKDEEEKTQTKKTVVANILLTRGHIFFLHF